MKKSNKFLKSFLAVTATAAILAPTAQPFNEAPVVKAAAGEQASSIKESKTGEYIITFKPSDKDTKNSIHTDHIKGYVKAFGGKVLDEGKELHFMVVKLPNVKVAEALSHKKEITSISSNDLVESAFEAMPSGWNGSDPNTPEATSWGYDEVIGEMKAKGVNATGKGVDVLVIDEGATDENPDLPFRKVNYTDTLNTEERLQAWEDDIMGNHAMGAAGIIGAKANGKGVRGVAPDSSVSFYQGSHPLYWADGSQRGTLLSNSYMLKGVDYALVNGMDIVSMSFKIGGYSPSIDITFEEAAQKGLILVAAAGNDASYNDPSDNDTTQYNGTYPADYKSVLSISAMKPTHTLAPYSNYGSIDFTAPTDSSSTGNNKAYVNNYYNGQFNGTSAATPFAAGIIALYKEMYPHLKRHQLLEIISSDATDMPNMTFDQEGFGRITAPTEESGVREDNLTHGGALYVSKSASGLSYGSSLKTYARLMDDPETVPYVNGQYVRGEEKPFEGATIRTEIKAPNGVTTYNTATTADMNGRYDLTIPVNTTYFPTTGTYTITTRYSFADPVTGQKLYSYKTQTVTVN